MENTDQNKLDELRFKIILAYSGNIELFESLKNHIKTNVNFNEFNFTDRVTPDHALKCATIEFLEKNVFNTLEALYLFNNEPDKCVNWTKGILKRYESDFADCFKSLILKGLNDNKRFQHYNNKLIYIQKEITNIDCSTLQKEPDIFCGYFEYFTGKNCFYDIKKFLEGWFAVRGLLQTENEIVSKFYNEHRAGLLQLLELDKITLEKVLPPQKQQIPKIKPIFNSEAIKTIFDLLKDYFPTQNKELEQVLKTGNTNKEKLLFNGSGKTLLDFFKQLMKGQFLTIVVQKDFEQWVSNGFEFLHRGKRTEFTPKYASKIISGNERAAKGNRLIDIKNIDGKFEIIQLEIRNREQN